MKKTYNDLDKLDEKLKRSGAFELDREPCFAEVSINECSALRVKNCFDCKFYKSAKDQLKVITKDTLKEINSYRGLIAEQTLKTLIGQAKKGDAEGARRGLERVKRMMAL